MSTKSRGTTEIELQKYNTKGWLKAFVFGIFFGLAVIVPGVSGSTIAIMFGLYASMLYAIGNIFGDFKKCAKFLIPIGIGTVLGFGAGLLLVKVLLEEYIFVVICLFVGLMLGASPTLLKEIKGEKANAWRVILLIIGVLIPLGIGALSVYLDQPVPIDTEATEAVEGFQYPIPWYLFVLYFPLGMLISATQLIPGLSATAILMALGQFKKIMDTLSFSDMIKNPIGYVKDNYQFLLLMICFACGFAAGLVIISKIFSKIVAWNRAATFYFVVGLSFGSIGSMFLNPDIVQIYYNWGHGDFSIIELIVGIVLLIIGLIGSLLLARYELLHENNSSK